MKKTVLASLLILPFGFSAFAQDKFSVGLGLGYQEKPYIGDNSEWLPIPHFEYQSGSLYIKGLKAGFYFINTPSLKLDLHLKYQSLSFKPGDSNGALRGLDRRKSTIELGGGMQYMFPNLVFIGGEVDADILGRSKGVNVDTNIGFVQHINDHFRVVPKAGVIWSDKKHNDYYYGVSQAESDRTGVRAYDPKSSFTPYIGVGSVVNATDNLQIFGGVQFQFMPNEVKDSPMTKRSTLSNIAIGVNYEF